MWTCALIGASVLCVSPAHRTDVPALPACPPFSSLLPGLALEVVVTTNATTAAVGQFVQVDLLVRDPSTLATATSAPTASFLVTATTSNGFFSIPYVTVKNGVGRTFLSDLTAEVVTITVVDIDGLGYTLPPALQVTFNPGECSLASLLLVVVVVVVWGDG
jgi:hypothetical protein